MSLVGALARSLGVRFGEWLWMACKRVLCFDHGSKRSCCVCQKGRYVYFQHLFLFFTQRNVLFSFDNALPSGRFSLSQTTETDDPPPTILTSTLVHRDTHAVPVRIVFYRTPRAHTHASMGGLANPRGNPLCPLVCQVSVLPPNRFPRMDSSVVSSSSGEASSCIDPGNDPGSANTRPARPGDATLFEELDTARGSSWQYELQQLKFANQRLHEELDALEGTSSGTDGSEVGNGGGNGSGVVSPPLSSDIAIPAVTPSLSHGQQPYQSLLPSSTTTIHPHDAVRSQVYRGHSQTNPHELFSTDWPSFTGTQGISNPLKRTWNSDDRAT